MFQKLLVISFVILMFSNAYGSDFGDESALSASDKVEALWHNYLNEELGPVEFYSQIHLLQIRNLSISDQLRLERIQQSFENKKLEAVFEISDEVSEKEALKLASEWLFIGKLVTNVSSKNLAKIKKAKKYLESLKSFKGKTKEEVKDLFYKSPDYAYYNNGEYKNTLKVYLFCRHDRSYPCLFVMRDIFDNEVRNDDGSLWGLPALAKSRRNLPYNITNGFTPQGVHTLDSVMPEANRQQAFGKWRRVKLNWVPKSKSEVNTKEFLPLSAHAKTWWHQANVARDVGRKWLRIHGTGNRNTDRNSTFYPHVPSAGCITTKEMKYDGIDYKDQRIILDTMMNSMQLAPVFANEVEIKGVIYVVELDDKKEKVTTESLKEYGIE